MNYDQAKAIAAQQAPELFVDPAYPSLPDLFVVRKTETGFPFSITLSHTIADLEPDEKLAVETELFMSALDMARKMLP